jgi:hypothetical protein
MSPFLPLATRPLMILTAVLDRPQALGDTPAGNRKIVNVLGGTVEGERISGRVLPGGGDWALTRADGALLLDVRLTLETTDSALVMARLAAGQPVAPSEMYFRTQPRFETADPRYSWLNRILAIGTGERLAEGPRYHIHEVL